MFFSLGALHCVLYHPEVGKEKYPEDGPCWCECVCVYTCARSVK